MPVAGNVKYFVFPAACPVYALDTPSYIKYFDLIRIPFQKSRTTSVTRKPSKAFLPQLHDDHDDDSRLYTLKPNAQT